jgi:hypothetical protein
METSKVARSDTRGKQITLWYAICFDFFMLFCSSVIGFNIDILSNQITLTR